jgi:capsule polysaccharide export protein KpsE/RkpR
MAAATERVPVLMTTTEKKRLARQAQKAGISLGEYLRRAAAAFSPEEEEEALAGLLSRVERSTAKAAAAVDEALAYVDASNKRIAAMEAASRRVSS